jgi:hypothetical protein
MAICFSKRIAAFKELGNVLKDRTQSRYYRDINSAIQKQSLENHWFTTSFISYSLDAIASMLNADELSVLENYYSLIQEIDLKLNKMIAVISAGNIPVAAFHDFFSILVSGNSFMGKQSSRDNILLPVIADILTDIEPEFKNTFCFVEKIASFDKVIATGSNNSSRYFEYYFNKYPHILRKNKNSMAILSGNETDEELAGLFNDIFLYFGLGCRSVSKLFVPHGYDFGNLLHLFEENSGEISAHHHYLNNLEYQRVLHLMNGNKFIDSGIVLLEEKKKVASPIGILNFQYYSSLDEVILFLQQNKDKIQCTVSGLSDIPDAVSFGKAQNPGIMNFADGIDTIQWCAAKN